MDRIPDSPKFALSPLVLLQAYQSVLGRSPNRTDIGTRYDALLDRLAKSDPDNVLVLSALAKRELAKRSSQGNSAALSYLSRAVERGSKSPQDFMLLGELLYRSGQRLQATADEAIVELQKAIALSPSSAEYRYNLGFALELRGNLAGAAGAFQKSVELSEGKDVRCLAALADAYDKTGRFSEAIQSARQAINLAVQEHDQQREQDLRYALERYERDGAKTQP